MKIEARIFLFIWIFCWLAAVGYGIWTDLPNSFSNGKVEWVGVAGLVLSGGLFLISGSFFLFVSRRIEPRPEDRPDAEIAEAAGDLGFFSPGSYWPVGMAGAATVVGIGFAFVQMWVVLVGVLLILFTVSGLLFEYYAHGRRLAEH